MPRPILRPHNSTLPVSVLVKHPFVVTRAYPPRGWAFSSREATEKAARKIKISPAAGRNLNLKPRWNYVTALAQRLSEQRLIPWDAASGPESCQSLSELVAPARRTGRGHTGRLQAAPASVAYRQSCLTCIAAIGVARVPEGPELLNRGLGFDPASCARDHTPETRLRGCGQSVRQGLYVSRTFMRKVVFAILGTTALLSTGTLATRVEAMTLSPLAAAAANTDLVQQAAVVCGPRGCVHRPTRPFRRRLFNRAPLGGWNTWNGCRPGWTRQGGRCAPYRWGR
jgi:hypothetical protein